MRPTSRPLASRTLTPRQVPRPLAATPADARDRVAHTRRRHTRRLTVVAAIAAAILIGAILTRALLGDYRISFPDALAIILGEQIPTATFILMESTLPRALMAALAGAAFGLAGGLFQAVLRNPLASPDIIGIGVGASATAVFGIVVLGWSGPMLSLAAVAGAVVVAIGIRAVAGSHPTHLVLVGVGTSAVLLSVIHYLFTRASIFDAQLMLRWLTGSVHGTTWPMIATVLLALVILGGLVAWLSRGLALIDLGPDLAAGLGGTARRPDTLLALAVLLMAVAVAGAGPVPFVAFCAPPLARALLHGRRSILLAGLIGAIITVTADYIAAYLFSDVSLPLGVVTGLAGAPILLWFLMTGRAGRA